MGGALGNDFMQRNLSLLTLSLLWGASVAQAQLVSIADRYIGGTDTHNAGNPIEYIGEGFKVHSMDVNFDSAGGTLGVTVFSDYFKNSNIGAFKTLPGDLFISQGYFYTATTYFANAPTVPGTTYANDTKDDNRLTGEDWEYVVKLEGQKTGNVFNTSGTVSVYAVLPGGIYTSNMWAAANGYNTPSYRWRKEQEVSYIPGLGEAVLITGTWERFQDRLEIEIPWIAELRTTGFRDEGFGFHWAMSCGNDVIEGWATPTSIVVVPEPSMIVVPALGALGILALLRRRKPKNSARV